MELQNQTNFLKDFISYKLIIRTYYIILKLPNQIGYISQSHPSISLRLPSLDKGEKQKKIKKAQGRNLFSYIIHTYLHICAFFVNTLDKNISVLLCKKQLDSKAVNDGVFICVPSDRLWMDTVVIQRDLIFIVSTFKCFPSTLWN